MTDENFPGLWGAAEKWPERDAIIELEGRTSTFQELAAASNQVARGIQSMGLEVGNSIAVMMPNCLEVFEVFYATAQTGMYYTGLNSQLVPEEIAYVLENSETKLVFVHERYREQLEEALEYCDLAADNCLWIDDGGAASSYTEFKNSQSKELPERRSSGHVMLYSSGTTGKPKGIRPDLPEAPPGAYESSRAFVAAVFDFVPGEGVHLVNGPLYHSGPNVYAMVAVHYGHTAIIMGKWDAEQALYAIDKYRVTNTMMVPTMFRRLLKLPEEVRAQYDLSSVTVLAHAAEPCPKPLKHAMIDWVGPILFEGYGGTEGPGTSCNSEEWLRKPGTVGKAMPGVEIKILDDEGNELPVGEVGTVYISAAQMGLPKYFKDEEKSQEAIRGNFFTLGDMGSVDEENWLFLADRRSDLIISGGVNIYPAEIEQVLQAHVDVYDAAVIGLPNEEWGQEVKAIVQLVDPGKGTDDMVQQLTEFCSTKLAKYKWPKSIDFAKIPRSDSGKLYKRKLKEKYLIEQ